MQGDFDGLCGLYALVNMLEMQLKKQGRDDDFCFDAKQALMKELVHEQATRRFMGRGWFSNAFTDGLDIDSMRKISLCVDQMVIKVQGRHYKIHCSAVAKEYDDIRNFKNDVEMAKDNYGIIIGLGGIMDHWAALQSFGPRRLTCYDSSRNKKLEIERDDLTCARSKPLHIDEALFYEIRFERC
eukprot:TRINITY_DN401_c0_g2_i1.p1 TRINITY_DN401_c0_g2~~TRINITY_DN401_c0_g2_i1.p1  ORF type:complete len:200 (+),score=23.69 TRINITY_DN401_c0_g2_i1:51-602(+)